MFTASKIQVSTYLFAVCLFSISFLVFLNASVSFVITDIIHQDRGIGDAVGTLGFADELVAIFCCPLWGVLSDRIGVQKVSSIGYAIVGLSLFIFVQAQNIYPGLLLARMFFSIGAAACTTMVTAILPAVTVEQISTPSRNVVGRPSTPSVSSELTITPARVQQQRKDGTQPLRSSPSRVAGIVGMFTGCGALVALVVFLPLPTRFKKEHVSDAQALKDTFYVVGAVAFCVSIACYLGLRKLQSEQRKGWHALWLRSGNETSETLGKPALTYWNLFSQSIKAGFQDYRIGLGYLGGFVARASSVGISLFVPLIVNDYFITSGRCKVDLKDPTAIKSQCKEAYILASMLTGISQLVALLCAPLFGYFSDKYRKFEIPLLLAAIAGVLGYGGFAGLKSPAPDGWDGSPIVFLPICLLGISQIGAIVCSLGLLGRGIAGLAESDKDSDNSSSETWDSTEPLLGSIDEHNESAHLLPNLKQEERSLTHIQGSIAGTYSLLGGVGILLLTKLGGYLFDTATPAAPFVMMAVFNALLFVGVLGTGLVRYRRLKSTETA